MIMGTLEKADSARSIDNHELSTLERKNTFRNQNIGFVFQFHQLLPEFALENVMIPR